MSGPRRELFSPRMHAAQCAAGLVIAASGVAIVEFVGTTWSWPLFLWGLMLGPATLLALRLQHEVAAKTLADAVPNHDDLQRLRTLGFQRYWSTYIGIGCIGFTVGAASASLGTLWLDAVATGWLIAGCALPLAALPALKRKIISQTAQRAGTEPS